MQHNIARVLGLLIVAVAAASVSGQTANQQAHALMIEDLQKAHYLLVTAIHDYDGRRAKASEEVHRALKELGHPKAAGQGKSKPGTKETQAVSDGKLREAHKLLEQALPLLNKHHPKAHANVVAAIHHIHVALEIK
jgi:hypothetical protein